MRFYITTYGRPTRQTTWRHLPLVLQRQTCLVVQAREAHLYAGYPVCVLPPQVQTLSPARQWVIDQHDVAQYGWKIVLLDDDLRFDRRRPDDLSKFLVATDQDIVAMFAAVEARLDMYVHVGVLAREGGNRRTVRELECTRMVRILAYDVRVLRKHGVRFDRLILQSDFDVTLQLLRLGYRNVVLCDWVHGQPASNTSGGCSAYRTLGLLKQNSRQLAALHAPFVKLVQRETKDAWGGGTRTDVVVQWRQAYLSRMQRMLL